VTVRMMRAEKSSSLRRTQNRLFADDHANGARQLRQKLGQGLTEPIVVSKNCNPALPFLTHLFLCPPNVDFSCELAWRGPCASTDRDKADRQLQILVRHRFPTATI